MHPGGMVEHLGSHDELVRPGQASQVRAARETTATERVDDALHSVSLDIRSGYTLAYVSSNTLRDATLRRIRLNVVALDGRRLIGRTRAGYVAVSEHGSDVEVRR